MELFHVNSGSLCFLVVFLLRVTDAAVPSNILTEHTELLQELKSYDIIKPYRLEGREKRYASTNSKDGHVQETTLFLDGIKKHFILDIFLNKELFSQNYSEKYVLHDGTRVEVQKPHEHCFYQGRVRGMDNSSSVSLSTCNGIEGSITTDEGLFFIYPLKSKEGNVLEEHLVFSDSDLNEEPVTCGHSHLISPKKELNHLKQISKTERRVRRSVQSETKYVELFIISDLSQYRKHAENTELRAKQLANHLDSIYRPYRIRIALVKTETWKDRNLISVDPNATITLNNFIKYKNEKLDKDRGAHWDNIQFLTGINFLKSTVGYAHIKSICGKRSAAVVQDHSSLAPVTAATMAHELGHNFGMLHDTNTCECPDSGKCIMAAILSPSPPAKKFSTCSLNYLRETLSEGYGTCLFDEPKMLTGSPICGNGFVEEGEQCDCGTREECEIYKNKCCNATTCMLHPEAACSHGECCFDCKLRSKGYLCREKYDECDLPEHCTGDKELCPEDTNVHNGLPCNKNDGYCYSGVCQSHKLQCQYLFGKDVIEGDEKCFNRNTKKNRFYGCYDKTLGNHPCEGPDVKCGRIHCLSDKKRRPVIGQDRTYVSVTVDGRQFCLVPFLTTGDGQDLQYVQDGTKCGPDMMCKDNKCLPISKVVPERHWQRCPNNCSLNGVCNNNGNCHCQSGYACPDCASTGSDSGGSVDSGQGCEIGKKKKKKKGDVNIAAAVLIPLFLILLIVIIVVVYIKRRTIQERLSHYKLVRRTASRASTPQPSRSRHTNAPRPTVSGPTIVSVHAPEPTKKAPTRREAPAKPSAPPAEDRYPASGARRPPFVSTQHQSVPLFPPSAAPEPQEPVKRPPPPRPEPEYQNVAPKAPARALPGKAKLPPSRPGQTNSVPDPVAKPETPRANVAPRPKPRAFREGHKSVPEFPDDVPGSGAPRNVAPRPGHLSVPLFNLPDASGDDENQSVRPSAVKQARQASKPTPPRKPSAPEQDDKPIDFRAGLKSVPKPWENN